MRKKHYIAPAAESITLQLSLLLTISDPSEIEIPWSGDSSGTAGPGEIDDYSTFDSLVRISDFE